MAHKSMWSPIFPTCAQMVDAKIKDQHLTNFKYFIDLKQFLTHFKYFIDLMHSNIDGL